jgi:hypothetical protein
VESKRKPTNHYHVRAGDRMQHDLLPPLEDSPPVVSHEITLFRFELLVEASPNRLYMY